MTIFAKPVPWCSAAFLALLLASFLAIAAHAQSTPSAASPPAPAAAPASPALLPQPPPPDYKPGFLHQMKVWWNDSLSVFDSKPKKTDASAADAATANTPAKAESAAKPPPTAETNAVGDAAKGTADVTQDALKKAVDATKGVADTAAGAMKNAVEATRNAADALVRLPGTRIIDVREPCAKAPNGGSDCTTAAANGCRAKGFASGSPLDVRTSDKCDAKPRAGADISGVVACSSEAVVIRAVCN
jgi:hypothetical protein